MRYALAAMSLLSLALIGIGVSLKWDVPTGLIAAGGMIWLESAIASVVTLLGNRRTQA